MRRPTIHVPAGGYRVGDRVRVFGPDASGALDTAAAIANGAAPVSATRRPESVAGEMTCGAETAFGRVEYAGAFRAPAFVGPAFLEPRAVSTLGSECEHGAQAFGAEAIDGVGQASASMATGTVLVKAAPVRPEGASVSTAGGTVTITND